MITITNLTKTFGEVKALDRLNCNINKGSVFGLVGSNGSGKSTLLRILAGVYEANGGTVRIDGRPSFDDQDVKSRVYFISDYPYFFNDSTVENHRRALQAAVPYVGRTQI